MPSDFWQILSLALSVLAAAIQIFGLGVPLWIWIENEQEHIGIGLFYRIGFESDDSTVKTPDGFENIKFDSDQTIDSKHWKAMASMEVISSFAGVLLIFALMHFARRASFNKNSYRFFRFALRTSILAWLFNGIGLVIFMIYHGDILTEGPEISAKTFSWAFLMCGFGFLLHISLTLIIYRCIWSDKESIAVQESTEPQTAPLPFPTNANVSPLYESDYYKGGNNGPTAIGDIAKMRRSLPDSPPSSQIPTQGLQTQDRSEWSANRDRRSFSLTEETPNGLGNEMRRGDSVYANHVKNGFQNVRDHHRGFDNQGFELNTTILDRQDQFENPKSIQRNDGDRNIRSSLYRELKKSVAARNDSGDVPRAPKPNPGRHVHRESGRHLSDTNRPPYHSLQDQRLSPPNLSHSSREFNGSYVFRPY